jgi:hypothetical protein
MYEKDEKECALKGTIGPGLRARGCELFVDKPWTINTSGGCCGMAGLPFADSEKLYDEVKETSEKEASEAAGKGRFMKGGL